MLRYSAVNLILIHKRSLVINTGGRGDICWYSGCSVDLADADELLKMALLRVSGLVPSMSRNDQGHADIYLMLTVGVEVRLQHVHWLVSGETEPCM